MFIILLKGKSCIPVTEYKLDNLVNKSLEQAQTLLNSKGVTYEVIGGGNKVIKQYPYKNETLTSKDNIYLIDYKKNYNYHQCNYQFYHKVNPFFITKLIIHY